MQQVKTRVQFLDDLESMEYVEAEYQNYRFPVHFHDTFVIQLVETGVDWCSGNEAAARSGQVFVHTPGAPHTGGTLEKSRLRYRAIYPGANLYEKLTGRTLSESGQPATWITENEAVVRRFRKFLNKCSSPGKKSDVSDSRERELTSVLNTLMEARSTSRRFLEQKTPVHKKMLQARQYLHQNFARDVTTDELASVSDLSKFHLIRCFRDHFGITPRQFLLSQRVANAKQLISNGMTVLEAAYACGFADQSHFSRYFKKISGYSPGKLRR